MTGNEPGEAATAPQELQNPLDFVRVGMEAARGGAPAVFIWAGGSIIGTAAVALPALVSGGHPAYAFWTFLVAAAAVAALSWLASRSPAYFHVQRRWRVIQQPLRADQLEPLTRQLQAVHDLVSTAVAHAWPGTDLEDRIRANIFLVDYRRAPEGVGCELRMPAQLRVRMGDPKEWEVAFQPGWGATGEAFRSAQPVLTTDRLYGIPAALRGLYDRLVSPRLKAVVSIPILDNEHANPVAVLNIDILDQALEYAQVNTVYEQTRDSAEFKALRTLINAMDKAWLTIGLQRA